jgi:hypothetical protein
MVDVCSAVYVAHNVTHTRHYTPHTPATNREKFVKKPHPYSE